MSQYSENDTNIEGFVIKHKLQKQADELWGEGWTADGDNEMIEALLESMGESSYYVTVTDGCIDVKYNYEFESSTQELLALRKTLRLALLQLQDYSSNGLIIAEGQTRNIQEELDKL